MKSFFKKMIALNLALLSVLITPGGVYAGDPLNSQTNPAEKPTATVPAGAVTPPPVNPLLKPPAGDSLGFINSNTSISMTSTPSASARDENPPDDRAIGLRVIEATVALIPIQEGKEINSYYGFIGPNGEKYRNRNTFSKGSIESVGQTLEKLMGKKISVKISQCQYSSCANNPLIVEVHSIVETKVGVPSVMLEKPVIFCTSSSSDMLYPNGGQVYCGAGDNPFKVGRAGYPDFDALVSLPQPAKSQGFTSWQQSAFGSLERLDFHSSSESYNYKTPGYQSSTTYLKEVTLPQQSYQPRPVTTTEIISFGPFTPTSATNAATDPLTKLASGYERNWFFINNTPAAGSPVNAVKMTAADIQELSKRLTAVYSYSSTYGMGASGTVWMFTEKAAEKVPGTNSTKVEALKAEVAAAQAETDKAAAADTKAQEQKKLSEKTLADAQLNAANASKAAAAAAKVSTKAKNDSEIAAKASTQAANDSAIAKKALAEALNAVAVAQKAVDFAKQPVGKAAAIKLLASKKLAATNASNAVAAAAQTAIKATNAAAVAAKVAADASKAAVAAEQTAARAAAIVVESKQKALTAAKAAVTSAQAKAAAGKILEAKKAALAAAAAPAPPKVPGVSVQIPQPAPPVNPEIPAIKTATGKIKYQWEGMLPGDPRTADPQYDPKGEFDVSISIDLTHFPGATVKVLIGPDQNHPVHTFNLQSSYPNGQPDSYHGSLYGISRNKLQSGALKVWVQVFGANNSILTSQQLNSPFRMELYPGE